MRIVATHFIPQIGFIAIVLLLWHLAFESRMRAFHYGYGNGGDVIALRVSS